MEGVLKTERHIAYNNAFQQGIENDNMLEGLNKIKRELEGCLLEDEMRKTAESIGMTLAAWEVTAQKWALRKLNEIIRKVEDYLE